MLPDFQIPVGRFKRYEARRWKNNLGAMFCIKVGFS